MGRMGRGATAQRLAMQAGRAVSRMKEFVSKSVKDSSSFK